MVPLRTREQLPDVGGPTGPDGPGGSLRLRRVDVPRTVLPVGSDDIRGPPGRGASGTPSTVSPVLVIARAEGEVVSVRVSQPAPTTRPTLEDTSHRDVEECRRGPASESPVGEPPARTEGSPGRTETLQSVVLTTVLPLVVDTRGPVREAE